jgi:hypothetical protein
VGILLERRSSLAFLECVETDSIHANPEPRHLEELGWGVVDMRPSYTQTYRPQDFVVVPPQGAFQTVLEVKEDDSLLIETQE